MSYPKQKKERKKDYGMEKRIILSVFQIKARKRRARSGVATAGLCGHSTWQTRTVAYSADRRSAQRVQRLPEAYIYLHQRGVDWRLQASRRPAAASESRAPKQAAADRAWTHARKGRMGVWPRRCCGQGSRVAYCLALPCCCH